MTRLSGPMLRLLRVPPRPVAPSGARDVQVFHASPRYFHYRLALWAIRQLAGLAGLMVGFYFLSRVDLPGTPGYVFTALEVFAWAGFVAQLPVSLLLVWLDYDMRWYIVTDRSLRIREGIVRLYEKTMTFANVQQISVRQNPLQRLLRIADVHVETAGGAGKPEGTAGRSHDSMHEARFTGVDNAEQIRDTIRVRVRMHRDAGLGDPDDQADVRPDPRAGTETLDAARDLLAEVRALRGAVTGQVAPPPPTPT